MPVPTLNNPARARLEAGEVSLGIGLRTTRTVDIAIMMKNSGMDWLFIDFEHSPMDLETAGQLSVAALGVGISPIVRIPNGELALGARALDSGALGIVVPHVESADEAREIVRQLRYAPQGQRGVSGMLPQFGYQPINLGEATVEINRSILVVVMLETARAVSRADEIAAVPGVDVVMLGTNDFANSCGYPGQFGHEVVGKAYDTLQHACKKHDKWVGSGGLSDPLHFDRYIKKGARFILAGSEAGFLMQGAKTRVELLRKIETA
ncbi:MAG TPA: aldolase/citrate lyase family protein [Devosiaceae bacterium]|jgi:2-keto-3-deoxy-L-rhamnonate aldolase RhmA